MFFSRGIAKVALALTWTVSASAWAAGGYVYDTVGEVTATTGKNAAQRIARNSAIVPDTMIKTGDKSYAVLKFEDGQVVTLQANSTFQVKKYNYDPKQADKNIAVFSMFKGGMRFITGLIGQQNKKAFRLATPNATIGIRGTEFMVAVVNGTVYSQVVAGSIRLTNDAGTSVFNAGQSVVASSMKSLPTAISAAKLPPGTFSQLESISTQSALQAPSVAQSPAPDAPTAGAAAGNIPAAPLGTLPLTGIGIAAGALTAAIPGVTPAATPSKPDVGLSSKRDVADRPLVVLAPDLVGTPASDAALVEATSGARKGAAAITRDEAAASLFGKHNFTATGIATGEICAFCHAPQGTEGKVAAPLWNRSQPTESSYKAFSTLGSATAASSGSVSMACLSCHDGMQAPNVVITSALKSGIDPNDANAQKTDSDSFLKGTHHPVGMPYAGGGVNNVTPAAPFILEDFRATSSSGSGTGTVWWVDRGGKGRQVTDLLLFTRTDTPDTESKSEPYVECASCHDPHSISNPTFLRSTGISVLCLTCHAK